MTNTLKHKAVRSSLWIVTGYTLSQILRLGSNLALTRLLVPEMFGIMAIVNVVMVGLAMFSDVGLLQNIVQSKRGEESDYLNTAWCIQIIRGFFIFFIAVLLSISLYYLGQLGYLSAETVYGNKQLPLILVVVSITAIISGFNSIYIFLLNRKLMMSKLIGIELLSQVIGLIFMLAWAWFNRDIWALVFGGIIGSITKMSLSHIINMGGKCHFYWEKDAVKEIFHFGKWIFLSSILGFFLNQGDRLILGGLLNTNLLGVYAIAFFLSNSLKDLIAKLLNSVFFPLLSEVVRESPNKVESTYYKIRLKIDILTMPVAGLLFSTGDVIIQILYDDRYISAGWMLEILSVSIIAIGFMLADQLFLSYGKSKFISISIFIQVISMYIFVPLAYFYSGLHGAIWMIALNPLLKIIFSMVIMKRQYFLNIYYEFRAFPLIIFGYLIGGQLKPFIS